METHGKRTQYKTETQVLFILLAGVLLAAMIAAALIFAYETRHADTIYPGVSVGSVDVSDLTTGQAVLKLKEQNDYSTQGQLLFAFDEMRWLYTPAQLGYALNPYVSAEKAFAVGRDASLVRSLAAQLNSARQGVRIGPTATYDQSRAYAVLQEIASQVDKPVVEAQITLNGTEVQVTAGQVGRSVDITATLALLDDFLLHERDGVIPLVVTEQQPEIMDAQAAADLASEILSQAFSLQMPAGYANLGPWVIEPADLARLILIERGDDGAGAEYKIAVNQQAINSYLVRLAPAVRTEPVNARFIFNDDTRQLELIQSAVVGQALNLEASVQTVLDALQSGAHSAQLVMERVDPQVKDDATAESLGITELVIAETSYFYGSDDARIQNISAAASSFHGLLIPPGATFSMASQLTDISLENGYAEALIIVGGETVKGVGGGVCQVSTTLFRTAFFGGFPIVERHAHAYRVGYYEQRSNGGWDTDLAGLDATVYVPLVDLKFVNDTPYWLLMETYLRGYSLTWKFYSTSDGRSVEWDTTGVTNVQPPPEPLYRENPELPAGTIKQVDWAVEGASVYVTRNVYRGGALYFNDSFETNYIPWQAIYEYGPGTDVP
ncbi:MAG TPA: VanW family protein [Anaerolineaceae bacterium]|nr:VanW family protein [Anaerolineaceae bacterium]HPS33252.1 VanW family protein [Anaerolineaceae bacterium]